MMEPFLTAATVVAATEFWKTIGKQLGEKVFTKVEDFLSKLRKKAPNAILATHQSNEQALNYGQAVLEIEALVKSDPEIAEATKALVTTVQEEKNEEILKLANTIIDILKNGQSQTQNFSNFAEKIGVINQGTIHNTNTIHI